MNSVEGKKKSNVVKFMASIESLKGGSSSTSDLFFSPRIIVRDPRV